MLEARGIRSGYGRVNILNDLSLVVDAGEMVALLGSNGVGKSTLMKTISGTIRAEAGTIRFNGKDITRAAPDEIVDVGLALVPEGRRLFNSMSVQDNLLIGNTARHARGQRTMLLKRVFDIFPVLGQRRGQAAGTLSGGEQQMVAIGRALMSAPQMLMLDEPSLGLSPSLTEQVFEALAELNRDSLAVLVVEQNVPLALSYCTRGYVVENGTVTLSDTAEGLRSDDRVRKAYLGM